MGILRTGMFTISFKVVYYYTSVIDEYSDAVQVSDTTMLNIVEKARFIIKNYKPKTSNPSSQFTKISELLVIM